ncbi:hypothetical protein [uncultured Deinococcus sp.]|uniref:hypothetical protein n=1 Tax=uncultured Deinococcus sp. TaxID=158789 RepID=UPI0025FFD93B|nr:hypothetical protein [uncultured Deinococcus sp.]
MTLEPTPPAPLDEPCPICGTPTEDMRHVDVECFYKVDERAPHLYARPRFQAVTPGPLYLGSMTRFSGGEALHHRPAADQPEPGVTRYTSAWEPLPEPDITLLEHTVYGIHCCKSCRADFIALFLAWSRGEVRGQRPSFSEDRNIPIREHGATRFITYEEWVAREAARAGS